MMFKRDTTTLAQILPGINFHELFYADDPLIVAKSFASATKYLQLIEEESDYLELNLNRSKCCYIACNCQGQIRFQNGEPMKSSEETTYLGASVRQHIDPKHEIRKRISATMAILKKLDIFWIKNALQQEMETTRFNGNFGAHGSSWKAIKHVPTKGFAKSSETTHHVRAAQQFQ